MKRWGVNITLTVLLILLLIFAASYDLRGQSLEISGFAQKTIMGTQTGYSIGYRSEKGLAASAFHQATIKSQAEHSGGNYPFSGVELSMPIKRCDNLTLYGNLRSGLVDQQFFIVTPELETRISVTRWLHLSVGAGIRSREAAISGRLIITTF